MKFQDIWKSKEGVVFNFMMILMPILLVLVIILGMLVGFFAFTTLGNCATLFTQKQGGIPMISYNSFLTQSVMSFPLSIRDRSRMKISKFWSPSSVL